MICMSCDSLDSSVLKKSVKRQLNYLVSQEAKSYFGLYCRPFATALAHLSFAYIAEKCKESDPAGFEKALADVQKNELDILW